MQTRVTTLPPVALLALTAGCAPAGEHQSVGTTEIYLRAGSGDKVTPTKSSTELRHATGFAERNATAKTAVTRMYIGGEPGTRTPDQRIMIPLL